MEKYPGWLNVNDTYKIKKDLYELKLKILRKSEVEAAGLMSYHQLAIKLEMSIHWVKKMISNLKIKHDRLIDRSKYFDEVALNKLSQYIENKEEKRGRPRKSG